MFVTSVRNTDDKHGLNYQIILTKSMNDKNRSSLAKNSNSLNNLIKGTSMTISHNDYTNAKKVLAISLAAIMVFGSFSLGSLTADYSAFGAKPQDKNGKNVIEWSNGVPSGAHHNLIGHGKKADYNCDDSPGGGSVFFSQYTNETVKETIEFISNQKSKVENLTAIDPCSEAFTGNDPIQVQIPYEEEGYYVFWSLKGGPDKGKNQVASNITLAGPIINHICNVTEAGSTVKDGDSDFGDSLLNFTSNIMHENSTGLTPLFDIGETVYDDIDTSQNVTNGDQRLANAGTWAYSDGSFVDDSGPGDDDLDLPLANFLNGTEMYRDTDSSLEYSMGEPIYNDVDMSGNVTANDIRLFVKDGSEALSCSDEDLINGAGAITDKEAFKVKNGSLERFDSASPQKGKGKSTFVDITGMFQWSGAVCDATILENATLNSQAPLDQISMEDFNGGAMDDVIEFSDLMATLGVDQLTAEGMIDDAELDAINDGGQDNSDPKSNNDQIDTDKEFAAFMENEFGDDYSCNAVYDFWVFNLAQIVNVGLEIINDGATNIQLRFYPVATTEFTPQ
jgi:hypothetical protein